MENKFPQSDEQIDYDNGQYYVGKKTLRVKLICVECKKKFTVPKLQESDYERSLPAFCYKCSQKRCMDCEIVLSKRYRCQNIGCHNKYHGMPSKEMPDCYCEGCIIHVKG